MKPVLKLPAWSAAVLMATAFTAHADSYDGSAALTFTLNSISNSDGNANDLSDLAISASFQEPTDSNDFYTATGGDGVFTDNNPGIASIPLINNTFSGNYTISATSLNGSVVSNTNGYYTLDFNNTSKVNSYTVDLTLSYLLTADAGGASLAAASAVELNYAYSGSNYVAGSNFTGFDYVFTNALYPGYTADSESQAGLAGLSFTLAPGESETFTANPFISGSLSATTAVPLPSAIWLFGIAMLGLLGVNQRQSKLAAG